MKSWFPFASLVCAHTHIRYLSTCVFSQFPYTWFSPPKKPSCVLWRTHKRSRINKLLSVLWQLSESKSKLNWHCVGALHGIKLCVCVRECFWFRGFCGRRSGEKLSLTPLLQPSYVSLYQVCIRMNARMNWLKIKMLNFYGYSTAIRIWEIDRPIRRQQQQHKGNKIYIWLLRTVFICMYISCQQDAIRLTNEQQANKIIDRDGRDTDCHSHLQPHLQASTMICYFVSISKHSISSHTHKKIICKFSDSILFCFKFPQRNTFSNSIFQTEEAKYLRR